MAVFFSILFVFFGVVSFLYGKKITPRAPQVDEDFSTFGSLDFEQIKDEKNEGTNGKKRSLQDEYFSYEREDVDETILPTRESDFRSFMPSDGSEAYEGFDLRQAVIYQTILNNKYVEINNNQ